MFSEEAEGLSQNEAGEWIFTDTETISACFHEWKEHFGLNDRFQYCVKCDQKKQFN